MVAVILVVYDLTGRAVATLEDGAQESGRHTLVFEGGHLPAGLYFCRITAGTETRTLSLVRTP